MKFPDLSEALCREVGTEFFYTSEDNQTDTSIYSFARKICAGCRVREACLEWGVKHEEHGMWGGLTPRERQAIRKSRNIILEQIRTGEHV